MAPVRTVMFIHGMFVTPKCWEGWIRQFQELGFHCSAPAWPFHDRPPAQLRREHPTPELARLTLVDLVAHHEKLIDQLPELPILIGHSLGGLLVQLLLQRGKGAAGVAIDSAPPLGVMTTRFSFLKSNLPILNPLALRKPYLMSFREFKYAFVHTLRPGQQVSSYDAQVVPESRRVGLGGLTSAAKIDFSRPHAPLLFVSGSEDRIIPTSLNKSNFRKYRDPGSVTDFFEFPGRTHYIIAQDGWEEVAESVLNWIHRRL
jgi:pimeloyl-ACP methyl ester carboxylesterase